MNNNIIFRQLFEKESSTYSYILADKETKESVIIDPVVETARRDIQLINELWLKLKYILETHIHADHITGSTILKEAFPQAKTVVGSKNTDVKCADIFVWEWDVIEFGTHKIDVIETPGHTVGCVSYIYDNMVFSWDALLIRSCGRTDFQWWSAESLYHSLQKIFSLSDDVYVYPAHDYKWLEVSTLWEEKEFNEMIWRGENKERFIEKMNNLDLDLPKKIHFAVPSNRVCWREKITDMSLLKTQ